MKRVKRCSKCKKEKPITEFYKNRVRKDGYKQYCKVCCSILDKEYRKQNPEKYRQIRRTSYIKHMTPNKRFNYRLKGVYGLSRLEFDEMYDKQKGKCKLCDKEIQVGISVHIDHNHKNNKIRGLLCGKCNLGLGHFYDNPAVLSKASKYILNDGDI